jgi:2-polyprenyl-6-methoxyphenol hydroxylase-like FAD-dependent oxidoreductase
MQFNIVIVGTGIGGLSSAIALASKGHHVTVLEATAKLQAVGGIIVTQPNACRMLDQFGLYKSFLQICGEQPIGEEIAVIAAEDARRLYGYPCVSKFFARTS